MGIYSHFHWRNASFISRPLEKEPENYILRPLHESVAKEKSAELLLIEVENEANNELLASFPTKSSEISAIFTRHPKGLILDNHKEK